MGALPPGGAPSHEWEDGGAPGFTRPSSVPRPSGPAFNRWCERRVVQVRPIPATIERKGAPRRRLKGREVEADGAAYGEGRASMAAMAMARMTAWSSGRGSATR